MLPGYFNRRHGRAGHLFQGRFKGHLIEEDGYFLEVSRYIHLNPVRAKLVATPQAWRWSSYPGYQQARRALEWVTYARMLGAFGSDSSQARREYSRFVRSSLDDPPQSPFATAVGGLLVGSEAFVDRIKRLLGAQPESQGLPELTLQALTPSLLKKLASQDTSRQKRWSTTACHGATVSHPPRQRLP